MADPNPILRFFDYAHLKPEQAEVSEVFHDAAWEIETMLDNSPEKSVALRKLLEAKDAAVRASLPDPDDE